MKYQSNRGNSSSSSSASVAKRFDLTSLLESRPLMINWGDISRTKKLMPTRGMATDSLRLITLLHPVRPFHTQWRECLGHRPLFARRLGFFFSLSYFLLHFLWRVFMEKHSFCQVVVQDGRRWLIQLSWKKWFVTVAVEPLLFTLTVFLTLLIYSPPCPLFLLLWWF